MPVLHQDIQDRFSWDEIRLKLDSMPLAPNRQIETNLEVVFDNGWVLETFFLESNGQPARQTYIWAAEHPEIQGNPLLTSGVSGQDRSVGVFDLADRYNYSLVVGFSKMVFSYICRLNRIYFGSSRRRLLLSTGSRRRG